MKRHPTFRKLLQDSCYASSALCVHISQGHGEKELSKSLRVQQKNRLDGYCREKSVVEAEITKRQKVLRENQRIIDIDL